MCVYIYIYIYSCKEGERGRQGEISREAAAEASACAPISDFMF